MTARDWERGSKKEIQKRKYVMKLVVVTMSMLVAGGALGQGKGEKGHKGKGATAADAKSAGGAGAIPPEVAASMAEMEKLGKPGAEHEKLKSLVGKWDAVVKAWMGPGEPTVSKGTAEIQSILDSRYVQETFSGDMMGQPFKGLSTTGYDNKKQKYVGTWIDSMSTTMMVSEGDMDPTGKVLTQNATVYSPMLKKNVNVKMITRIESNDKHVMEMWEPGRDGKDVRTMEITYTRKK
jgi:hypothetical protein